MRHRTSRVSTGHARELRGSPATAVVNGYEQALGARLGEAQLIASSDTLGGGNSAGQEADQMKRRVFTAAIAAVAAGGPLGEPIQRAVAALGGAGVPSRVGLADVIQVEQAEEMFTAWDLRFGGGLAQEMAAAQLRWATGLLQAQMSDEVRIRLYTAIGSLAERAAWSSFDAARHEPARSLFKLALYAATEANDADLRGHILSDIATQQLYLGSPRDCLTVVRLAEGDDRISAGVRFVLHGVKARAYGAIGEATGCAEQINRAEAAYASVRPDRTPAWMAGFLCDAHVHSVTGQAAYDLARARDEFDEGAHLRLAAAVSGFGGDRARAVALCSTRLAVMHLAAGHLAEGCAAAEVALGVAPGLRSARIRWDLAAVRDAAGRHAGDDGLRAIGSRVADVLAAA